MSDENLSQNNKSKSVSVTVLVFCIGHLSLPPFPDNPRPVSLDTFGIFVVQMRPYGSPLVTLLDSHPEKNTHLNYLLSVNSGYTELCSDDSAHYALHSYYRNYVSLSKSTLLRILVRLNKNLSFRRLGLYVNTSKFCLLAIEEIPKTSPFPNFPVWLSEPRCPEMFVPAWSSLPWMAIDSFSWKSSFERNLKRDDYVQSKNLPLRLC